MTPARWQQLKQIFQSALERRPVERTAFVAQACGDDVALRREVESLSPLTIKPEIPFTQALP